MDYYIGSLIIFWFINIYFWFGTLFEGPLVWLSFPWCNTPPLSPEYTSGDSPILILSLIVQYLILLLLFYRFEDNTNFFFLMKHPKWRETRWDVNETFTICTVRTVGDSSIIRIITSPFGNIYVPSSLWMIFQTIFWSIDFLLPYLIHKNKLVVLILVLHQVIATWTSCYPPPPSYLSFLGCSIIFVRGWVTIFHSFTNS